MLIYPDCPPKDWLDVNRPTSRWRAGNDRLMRRRGDELDFLSIRFCNPRTKEGPSGSPVPPNRFMLSSSYWRCSFIINCLSFLLPRASSFNLRASTGFAGWKLSALRKTSSLSGFGYGVVDLKDWMEKSFMYCNYYSVKDKRGKRTVRNAIFLQARWVYEIFYRIAGFE